MSALWPWLMVAGVGALHGLNPATGWMFAAVSGVRSGSSAQALRALIPIGLGHAAAMGMMAAAVALGLWMDRCAMQLVAIGVVSLVVIGHRCGGVTTNGASQAGLALWSFLLSSAHNAGLMLVPALMSLCVAGAATPTLTASGSIALAVTAVVVHTGAMLVAAGAITIATCYGVRHAPALFPASSRTGTQADPSVLSLAAILRSRPAKSADIG